MTPEQKEKNAGQAKTVTIIVNAREHEVEKGELSYAKVVALAYGGNPPSGPYIVITITYRRGHGQKPEGTLDEGGSVKVKEGMIFNVTATDKS